VSIVVAYGALVSVAPIATPSIWNSTLATATLSVAVAVTATAPTRPLARFAGAVSATVGGAPPHSARRLDQPRLERIDPLARQGGDRDDVRAREPRRRQQVRDLGRDLYVTLEDAEYDALDACAQAGFAVHRRESYYRIPADRAVARLAGAVLPAGLGVLSAADADITRLRLLDDALRQDVPGSEGWRWDAEQFRAETFGPFFDPATYLVAVDRASGEYAGLVRIWRNRAGPRLGLIATLAQYRRRGIARALLGQAFAVLAARGDTSVASEVDDTNVASVSLLTGLGARRYGGNAELIRRQPGRSARGGPEERRPSAGP